MILLYKKSAVVSATRSSSADGMSRIDTERVAVLRAVFLFIFMMEVVASMSCVGDRDSNTRSNLRANLLVAPTRIDTLLLLRVDSHRAEKTELKVVTGGYFQAIAAVGRNVFAAVGCQPHSRDCVRGLYAVSLEESTAELLIDGSGGDIWSTTLTELGGLLYMAGSTGLVEVDPRSRSYRTVASVEFAPQTTTVIGSEGRLYFLNRETALQWVDPLTGLSGSQSFEIPNPGHPAPATLLGIVDGCIVFGDAKGRQATPLEGAASTEVSCARLRRPTEGGRSRSSAGMTWVVRNYEFPTQRATLTEIGSGRRVSLPGWNVFDWCFLAQASSEEESP
jgi:hypothetical protein